METGRLIWITSAIVFGFSLLIFLTILIFGKLRAPVCIGYLDPNGRWCASGGQLVSKKPIPSSKCDPRPIETFGTNMIDFLDYLETQTLISKRQHKLANALAPLGKTYHGFLLFALPELLKIMPSDFGQNHSTPYGIVCFYDVFMDCIQEKQKVCTFLAGPNKDPLVLAGCNFYLNLKKRDPSILRDMFLAPSERRRDFFPSDRAPVNQ